MARSTGANRFNHQRKNDHPMRKIIEIGPPKPSPSKDSITNLNAKKGNKNNATAKNPNSTAVIFKNIFATDLPNAPLFSIPQYIENANVG